MSSSDSTSLAPSLIRACVPFEAYESILPGIAKTVRPCSSAMAAVIREPLLLAASITTTPSERPLITLLRSGKFVFCGVAPRGNSVITAPDAAILSASFLFSAGYRRSRPLPRTAIVLPPALSAPWWAAVSIPLASPLTTVRPIRAIWEARRSALILP